MNLPVFQWISAIIHWKSANFTVFQWISANFHWKSANFTVFQWISAIFTGFQLILLFFSEFQLILLENTENDRKTLKSMARHTPRSTPAGSTPSIIHWLPPTLPPYPPAHPPSVYRQHRTERWHGVPKLFTRLLSFTTRKALYTVSGWPHEVGSWEMAGSPEK